MGYCMVITSSEERSHTSRPLRILFLTCIEVDRIKQACFNTALCAIIGIIGNICICGVGV